MAKHKPKVDMDKVRRDCYKYDPKRKECIALDALYCGVEGEKECSWFKPRSRVPMQGTAVSCKFCGKPFIPKKYANYQTKYCSAECREKARYTKKILPGGGRFRDTEEVET